MNRILAALLLVSAAAGAAELKPRTVEAFDRYIQGVEARLASRMPPNGFLWADQDPARLKAVRAGQIAIQPLVGQGDTDVPDGLIHDWAASVFVPNVTLERTLRAVQDYNSNKLTHKPEVLDSKLLFRNGNDFRIYLRLMKKKVITVVLNTEHEVHYTPVDLTRWYSRSYSTRIAEVDGDRELPPGQGHGFLWRLNSYWRFQERDGGVYVECQAVSLTRDVPTGLGWLIEPIVRKLPRESLENTLRSTRNAIAR